MMYNLKKHRGLAPVVPRTFLLAAWLCSWGATIEARAEDKAFPGQRSAAELEREGFKPLFDGKSLAGWDVQARHKGHWTANSGVLDYDGLAEHSREKDASLWTTGEYGDLVLYCEWRLPARPVLKPHPIVLYNGDFLMQEDNPRVRETRPGLDAGDSGLYFRGSKRCQANIWSQTLGSGEINGYRTDKSMPPQVRRGCIPIKNADRPFGEWNAFMITIRGNKMTVVLNGEEVIPAVALPDLPQRGPIALQHHGDPVQFRNLWIKELAQVQRQGQDEAADKETGYVSLFNGRDLTGWRLKRADRQGYVVEDGLLVCPADGGGFLFTDKEYADFSLRFDFRLTKAANNGIAIRCPLVDAGPAYEGMEIQILDNVGYPRELRPAQYHGSVYDVIPAKRGALKPVGEWNSQEIVCRGRKIKVIVNDVVVLDADLDDVTDAEVLKKHPGLSRKSGHIGLLGHGARVEFRNLRVKEFN